MKTILALTLLLTLFCTSCNKNIDKWDEQYSLSIMSFNLRYDTSEDGENQWSNRKDACILMLEEIQPHILGIQEGLENQVYFLNEQLPWHDYVGVGRDDGEAMGEYSAIFFDTTLFSKMETGNFWLSETPEIPSMGWDAACIRIVTWVQLLNKNSNEILYVFNTHFDHEGKEAQQESGYLLIEKIESITQWAYPVFITGDFNVLASNKALNPILEECNDARKEAQYCSNGKSFNAFGRGGGFMNRDIDYIFYKNYLAPTAFKTIKKTYGVPYISDHYPIIAYF